ncbi:MAG: hypothetical protein WCC06_12860 [Candidatus Aminicenantales bacterium]
MDRRVGFFILCLALFLSVSGCKARQQTPPPSLPQGMAQETGEKQRILTVEEITREAHALFEKAIDEKIAKEKAVEKVIEFLKRQNNVKEVKVTGSDSVHVFFTDGNDLLIMLGRGRI